MFTAMPAGWHFGQGIAPSSNAAQLAIYLIAQFEHSGAEVIEAFPEADGGILISAYDGDSTVDALLRFDKRIEWDDRKSDDPKFLTFDEALNLIWSLDWPKKSSG